MDVRGGSSGGGSGTVTSVSSANTSISVATPTTTPALTVATLDVLATNGPPAAAVALNSQKITGLANGSAASDAASIAQTKSRHQIKLAALGVLSENQDRMLVTGGVATVSQTVYGSLLGLRNGDVVTGVLLTNNVAAAGTTPTTVRSGIADSTGKILALSNNLNATTNFPATGGCLLAFSSPFTITADGGYYACFVINGTWGTTQPTPGRNPNAPALGQGINSGAVLHFSWTGQTDLPAVNSSLTLTSNLSIAYYIAFYGTAVT